MHRCTLFVWCALRYSRCIWTVEWHVSEFQLQPSIQQKYIPICTMLVSWYRLLLDSWCLTSKRTWEVIRQYVSLFHGLVFTTCQREEIYIMLEDDWAWLASMLILCDHGNIEIHWVNDEMPLSQLFLYNFWVFLSVVVEFYEDNPNPNSRMMGCRILINYKP